MIVYLAGPISGKSYDDAVAWRTEAELMLRQRRPYTIVLSPMRGKEMLSGEHALAANPEYATHGPLSSRTMFQRDIHDVRRSSVILAYLRGAERASVGTLFELGVAYEARVPIVLVVAPGDVHWHLFPLQAAMLVTSTLEAAVEWIDAALDPR